MTIACLESVRLREAWEQDASLRLREGDASVLAEYDDHGQIRGNPPGEATEDARRLYVASYIQGADVELIIHSNALTREMARRIRDDLQHLGIVQRPSGSSRPGAVSCTTSCWEM